MSLVIKLFGAVLATHKGVPLKFATDHARALLAYLAVESGIVHPRTNLATLLWPNEGEARARQNLRQALLFLKQSLSAVEEHDTFIHITATTLQWTGQGVEVDLHAFRQSWEFSQSHDHADLRLCVTCLENFSQALALYQEEFLQGLFLKESQLFEEWTLLIRERCHRQAMEMLGALVAHHLANGNHREAASYARRQVTLEPWHEEGHRHLMQALAAQGQQSLALRQYESCRRLLQQELGVPPAPETTRLYEQIRAGNFEQAMRSPTRAASRTVRHNLSVILPPLIGRSQELEQLRSHLSNSTQRLLTITGLGGIGKSRVALGLLEQLIGESPPQFAHGVWFVPMVGLSPNVENLTDGLVGAIFKALGVTTPNQALLPSALFHYLAQRQLLLVFDSFEHLLVDEGAATASTKFILALLQAAPEVRVVVTSRQPLELSLETVIRLEGLPLPPVLAAEVDKRDAVNYESVRLFLYHVQRVLPGFALQDDTLRSVIELCHALGGMPLAIELAATLTPHFAPAELVVALRQNLDLLVSQRRDLDERHRHFSAVLGSSWQLLSAREQAILAQSSVFVGSFSRMAAQMVTRATVAELASLVNKSLVQQSGIGVYQLHDLLRQFANDKLHTSPQEAFAVAERHSAFYLNFVVERERMLTRDQPRQAVEEIQQEVDNVRQAWAWAVTHTAPTLGTSAYGLWHYYLITGLYTEGATLFRQAIEGIQAAIIEIDEPITPDANIAAQGHEAGGYTLLRRSWQQQLSSLLAFEACMLCIQDQYGKAQNVAEQAVVLAVAHDSSAGELVGLMALTQALYIQGQEDTAKSYAEQLLRCAQRFQWNGEAPEFFHDAKMTAYLYLGVIARNAGDYAEAASYWHQVLQLCQPLSKMRGVMHARLNLANLARFQQRYAIARKEYEEVLEIARELGYRWGEGVAHHELADTIRGQGEYSLALEHLAKATIILREIGESWRICSILSELTSLYIYMGDLTQAAEMMQQALTHSQQVTLPTALQDAWLAAALFYHYTGDNEEALQYAIRCQQSAQARHERRFVAIAAIYMGYALEELGRWDEAYQVYESAHILYEELDIQPAKIEAQAGSARIRLLQNDQAAAQIWVDQILPQLDTYQNAGVDEPFLIYLTCYKVLVANHDARANTLLQRGYDLLQRYAAQIHDHTLRRSFLENVLVHRELRELYELGKLANIPA